MKNLVRELLGRGFVPTKPRFDRHWHLPFEELTNVRLHSTLAPLIESNAATQSFEVVRELMWVDNSHPPIRPVLAFEKMKGGELFFNYGLSVDFVPIVVGKRAIMRSGEKSVKFDLIIDPRDHGICIGFTYGSAAALEDAHRAIPAVLSRAVPFWSRHRTVAKLAEAVRIEEDHMKAGGLGVDNYVQAGFARPFLLAAAGETERAERFWKSQIGYALLDETGQRRAQDQFDIVMGGDFRTE